MGIVKKKWGVGEPEVPICVDVTNQRPSLSVACSLAILMSVLHAIIDSPNKETAKKVNYFIGIIW